MAVVGTGVDGVGTGAEGAGLGVEGVAVRVDRADRGRLVVCRLRLRRARCE